MLAAETKSAQNPWQCNNGMRFPMLKDCANVSVILTGLHVLYISGNTCERRNDQVMFHKKLLLLTGAGILSRIEDIHPRRHTTKV